MLDISKLVNTSLIRSTIHPSDTPETRWDSSHGFEDNDFLGAGMLYYAIAYALKARTCVCLGSGGGFVPRLMRQAQRDVGLDDSETFLVDANLPEAGWESPAWAKTSNESPFLRDYPDISIRVETTDNALEFFESRKEGIDYLHVDADHSYEQCAKDLRGYGELVTAQGIITLHDTSPGNGPEVHRVIEECRSEGAYDLIDLRWLGRGTAILVRRT